MLNWSKTRIESPSMPIGGIIYAYSQRHQHCEKNTRKK